MPPIWSGTLTFGLVAMPVAMRSAVSSHKVAFRQIHLADQGRVRYRKKCELDDQVLTEGEIGRAYEAGKDNLVPLSDDELDALPLPTAKTIEIDGFVDLATLPPEMIGKAYYLAPSNPGAHKPYVLMRRALERSGKAAVGKVAMRGTGERLVLVRAYEDILAVLDLHWPDELRDPGDAVPTGGSAPTEEEIQAAVDYIHAMGDIDMAEMEDEYTRAVESLIDAKSQHKKPPKPEQPPAREGVTDLMSALKEAADQARKGRGRDADVHDISGRRTARKTTAKKTAKKTAAKTTTHTRKRTG